MVKSRTALFVIDIQHFLANDPDTRIPHAEKLKAAGREILSTARNLTDSDGQDVGLIVFVQHEQNPENGALVRGTEPWTLVFQPDEGASNEWLVHKTTGDTFESNTDLADKLKQREIDHIVAFGIQSECCVEATSKGALSAGFKLSLLQGAHSTYDAGDATALEIEKEVEELLAGLGAQIVPYKEALESWKAAGVIC